MLQSRKKGIDMEALSGNILPEYKFSSYRFFERGEKHVNRICNEDVLLIIFSGTLRFFENGEPIELSAGEYYIQEKGLYQAGILQSDEPVYYYIHFNGCFDDGESKFLKKRGVFEPFLLHNLIKKLETAKGYESNIVEAYHVFLSILAALSGKENTDDSLSYKMYKYVRDNIKSNITLDMLAEYFGYCKNHIIKLFKKTFNMTPYEYIVMRRVELAKNLLISSELSYAEIAAESGFGSYVNLYKAFVKSENCSPGDFRKSKINA